MNDLTRRLVKAAEQAHQDHLAQEIYTSEDEERIINIEFSMPDETQASLLKIDDLLADVVRYSDRNLEPNFTSHRDGMGKLIVMAKKIMFKITRPYVDVVLAKQLFLNDRMLELLEELTDGMIRTYNSNQAISAELDLTKKRLAVLADRLETIDSAAEPPPGQPTDPSA